MKNTITLLLIMGLFSCGEKQRPLPSIEADNLTTAQIDSILTEFNFNYQSPILIDSSYQVLIPISTELIENEGRFGSGGLSGGYSSGKGSKNYWNILFFNRETGATRLLTTDKVSIANIHVNRNNSYREEDQVIPQKILYRMSDTDFNKDERLNWRDPEFLFSSEIDGSQLKRISPMNEDLVSYRVIPNTNQILIQTRKDVNKDKVFDRKDENIWYKADLVNQEWTLQEIIDSVGRKRIETLYFEQWLKKQK